MGSVNRVSVARPVTSDSGEDGPEAIYWLDKGYGCAVVGSLPHERLAAVAKSAYGQLLAGLAS